MDTPLEGLTIMDTPLEGLTIMDTPLEGLTTMDTPLEDLTIMDTSLEGLTIMDTPLEGLTFVGMWSSYICIVHSQFGVHTQVYMGNSTYSHVYIQLTYAIIYYVYASSIYILVNV